MENMNTENMKSILRILLARITPRRVLFFDLEVTEHCNLNCKGCGSLAPLAEEEYLDINVCEHDLKKMSIISGGVVHHISILGGEPLLHPQIIEIMAMTRKYFPRGVIYLVTNGILVDKMPEEFWKTLKDSRITLAPTRYPINVDYDAIAAKAKERGIAFKFFGNQTEANSHWAHMALDIEGLQYEQHNFMRCINANICAILSNGKFWSCVRPYKIRHFNKKFGTDLYIDSEDYLVVDEIKSLDEVMSFLARPLPFCRFCNPFANHETKWELSKANIAEWT